MEFPDTIEGFGYEWSEDGKLLHKESGKPFQFEVKKDNHTFNQRHYEALGELITPFVYELLEKRCGLQRRPVPVDAAENEPQTFIFCSKDFQKAEKLMVLIHGTGVVRAGQWARRLIINDCLDSGTQIPFIIRAIKEGYGVLVMNTNDNGNICTRIRGSENAENHGKYVWKKYVKECAAKKIALVAHSYGGVVTSSLYQKFQYDFYKRVFAVAMTDSVHFASKEIKKLRKVARNWVTSEQPLDTEITRSYRYTKVKDIPCVSAGCLQHEMTSWSSFESIFKFFEEKLNGVSTVPNSSTDVSPSKKSLKPVDHLVSSDGEESMDVEIVAEKEKNVAEKANGEGAHDEVSGAGVDVTQVADGGERKAKAARLEKVK